jgi:hypothetical protein
MEAAGLLEAIYLSTKTTCRNIQEGHWTKCTEDKCE